MPLQSQAPRAPQRLLPATAPKGLSGNTKLALGGVGAIAIGTAAILAFKLGMGTSPAPANAGVTDPLNQPETTNQAPATNPASPAAITPPPAPAPATIQMGHQDSRSLVPGPANNPPNNTAATPPVPGPTGPGTTPPFGTPGSNPATENPTAPALPQAPTPGNHPTPATGTPLNPDGTSLLPERETPAVSEGRRLMDQAQRAQSEGRPVEARALLNRVLLDSRIPANERGAVRQQLATLNESLVFGTAVGKGDPFCDLYTIASGDSLVTIRSKQSLPIDWRLLQRINKVNPNALRIGQKVKIVRMPFHAVVSKSEFRLDLYMGDPPTGGMARDPGPDGQDPAWTYIRSFRVGLGESNGTPEGVFTVKPKSKLVNPHWVNPRTGERFSADDPKNPIGEYWIGLEGADEASKKFTSYGLHGTIDPGSIGASKSMGCVRLGADDIALMYEVLAERVSVVRIVK